MPREDHDIMDHDLRSIVTIQQPGKLDLQLPHTHERSAFACAACEIAWLRAQRLLMLGHLAHCQDNTEGRPRRGRRRPAALTRYADEWTRL
jgi:hypothetical protein